MHFFQRVFKKLRALRVWNVTTVGLAILFLAKAGWGQTDAAFERAQAQAMLADVSTDVKKHYYNPQLLGAGWDAKVREAKEKIETEGSINRAMSVVAATLDSLNDSHTFFVPPPRPYVLDYGFQMQMIGDRCFLTRIRPHSDAEGKGLKAGDQVLTVNGYTPTRGDFWRMQYLFWVLRPQMGLRLEIRTPAGEERQVEVTAKFRQRPQVRDLSGSEIFDFIREMENEDDLLRVRYVEKGDALLILKLPEFFPPGAEIDEIIGKMRKHDAVILDLRDNPGGAVDTLRALLGGIFEEKVKIGDRLARDSSKPMETVPQHHPFMGKLVVLVDSNSASAAELFSRVVQIQKRGIALGDLSSGKVMESRIYGHSEGVGDIILYGASITEADIRMTDGQSLERRGVTPDQIVLPTAEDLANGRDPVLAEAAEMLNVKISPEEAGKFFPYEWPKD